MAEVGGLQRHARDALHLDRGQLVAVGQPLESVVATGADLTHPVHRARTPHEQHSLDDVRASDGLAFGLIGRGDGGQAGPAFLEHPQPHGPLDQLSAGGRADPELPLHLSLVQQAPMSHHGRQLPQPRQPAAAEYPGGQDQQGGGDRQHAKARHHPAAEPALLRGHVGRERQHEGADHQPGEPEAAQQRRGKQRRPRPAAGRPDHRTVARQIDPHGPPLHRRPLLRLVYGQLGIQPVAVLGRGQRAAQSQLAQGRDRHPYPVGARLGDHTLAGPTRGPQLVGAGCLFGPLAPLRHQGRQDPAAEEYLRGTWR